jgi:protoporphyrinogen IX oxidase
MTSYLYLKAIHIIFIVTWFAGLFYFPRLLIYNTEANEKETAVKNALQQQYSLMMKRLWFGITWPSAILTLILGTTVMLKANWDKVLFTPAGNWLLVKLVFVVLLYVYHFSLQALFFQQRKGVFRYSSQQLRFWNEVATIFLVAIVLLATVKQTLSWVYGIAALIAFIIILVIAIRIYKKVRERG